MKQCPDRAIELFIKKVNVFENKIEISLNYSLNTNISKTETTSKKLFTEYLHLLVNSKAEQLKRQIKSMKFTW